MRRDDERTYAGCETEEAVARHVVRMHDVGTKTTHDSSRGMHAKEVARLPERRCPEVMDAIVGDRRLPVAACDDVDLMATVGEEGRPPLRVKGAMVGDEGDPHQRGAKRATMGRCRAARRREAVGGTSLVEGARAVTKVSSMRDTTTLPASGASPDVAEHTTGMASLHGRG